MDTMNDLAIESWNVNVRQNKQIRKELDIQLQILKNSDRKSRSRSLSITHLEDAIMRLGMDLKELRETAPEGCDPDALNPYPQSYNPANTKIEPTADGLKL